jgi:glucose-1-phosphate adenylyltransferase
MTGGLRTETAIGRHCRIRNAIIDKNVLLPSGTVIGYNRDDDDRRGLKTSDIPGTSDYLVAVPKGYTVS